MATSRKVEIGRTFGRAAATYDRHAGIQRIAAERLAERIAALPLPGHPRILEVGCGTGFLTEALHARLPRADWVVSDLSAEMIGVARAATEPAGRRLVVMDGERPCFAPGRFDLVCSGLAVQWFEHLETGLAGLAGLVKPGGWLAFSTLLADSLIEWRRAHDELGLSAATPAYPQPDQLAAWTLAGEALRLEEERLVDRHASGAEFLSSIRGIGASAPAAGRKSLSGPQLRRVLVRFDQNGPSSTYHLGYGTWRRPG